MFIYLILIYKYIVCVMEEIYADLISNSCLAVFQARNFYPVTSALILQAWLISLSALQAVKGSETFELRGQVERPPELL